MGPTVEKIYYRSPTLIQNIGVSLLGLKLAGERFNKAGNSMFAKLMESQNYNEEKIAAYQDSAFVEIARHAICSTPYYRRWAFENAITVSDINSISDLKKFPIIEKDFLRSHAEEFRSDSKSFTPNQFTLHTSGTTGTPLTIYTDKISRSRHYAFFSRLRAQYGIKHSDKRATLFGRIIMLASQKKPPFWRYDMFNKNLLMSSYHLNTENLIHYYRKLCAFKPQEIFAYPSSIFALANYIVRNNLPPITLKLVMTTAENLLPQHRKIISEAFKGPLVNQYGCTEMAFFCSDFPDGTMKFHPEHGIVEVRNESELTTKGEGDLIATGFINYSMPVIRYVIGDRVNLSGNDGQGRQILASVSGRIDDVVYTSTGAPVGRLDPIFKGGSGIRYAQIVQSENGSILLKLVPDKDYSSDHGETLKRELIKRVGTGIDISIVLLDSIEKERNGKFRPVISYYKK